MTRLLAMAVLALTACAGPPQPPQTVAAPPPPSLTSAERGLAFAQARCSGCHEITATGISPNPASPPFAAVVNKPGVTRDTLRQFLRDSHNFPDAMNFRVDGEQINDLADYMLTLQASGYHPPI